MATNHVTSGAYFPYTNSSGSDIASGAVVVLTDMIGIAAADIPDGESGVLLTEEVFTLAKLSTDTITIGQIVYWDAGNSRITETASSHARAGKAYEAAGSGATTVKVKLNV